MIEKIEQGVNPLLAELKLLERKYDNSDWADSVVAVVDAKFNKPIYKHILIHLRQESTLLFTDLYDHYMSTCKTGEQSPIAQQTFRKRITELERAGLVVSHQTGIASLILFTLSAYEVSSVRIKVEEIKENMRKERFGRFFQRCEEFFDSLEEDIKRIDLITLKEIVDDRNKAGNRNSTLFEYELTAYASEIRDRLFMSQHVHLIEDSEVRLLFDITVSSTMAEEKE